MDFEKTVNEKETDIIIKLQAEIERLRRENHQTYLKGRSKGFEDCKQYADRLEIKIERLKYELDVMTAAYEGLFNEGQAKVIAKQDKQIERLTEICQFAYDIHTRDPVTVKLKWGCCGVNAEEKLEKMIEQVQNKGGE